MSILEIINIILFILNILFSIHGIVKHIYGNPNESIAYLSSLLGWSCALLMAL